MKNPSDKTQALQKHLIVSSVTFFHASPTHLITFSTFTSKALMHLNNLQFLPKQISLEAYDSEPKSSLSHRGQEVLRLMLYRQARKLCLYMLLYFAAKSGGWHRSSFTSQLDIDFRQHVIKYHPCFSLAIVGNWELILLKHRGFSDFHITIGLHSLFPAPFTINVMVDRCLDFFTFFHFLPKAFVRK